MNNKTTKIVFYVSTGLMTLLMLMSVGMYFFNYQEVSATFETLGYPSYVIYPLAVLKLAGLAVIWYKGLPSLREWAYAGFFFDFVLAFFAHVMVADGEYIPALVAIVLLFVSYFSSKKYRAQA
ncbi:MAG: DoxX family protein [Chitinophagales bacterium]